MRRALAALLLLAVASAHAAVPQRLNYQGKLANAAGDPLSGTYSFRFKLFAAETGGAALFSEDVTGANAVSVVNGIYTVQIGSFTTGGIPYGVFDGPDLYLEVDVNAGSNLTGAETLTPRERLNSAAWAVHALGAERLGTGAVIATFTATGNLQLVAGSTLTSNGTFSLSTAASAALTGAPALFVDRAGEVGLGTVNPTYRLDVVGTEAGIDGHTFAVRNTNNAANAAASFKLVTAGAAAGNPFAHFTVAGATDWTFGIDNADADKFKLTPYFVLGNTAAGLTVDTTGNVGVSTGAPQAAMHVVGGGASYANAFIVDTLAAGGGTVILGNDGVNGDQVRVGTNGYLRSQAGRFGLDSTGSPLTFEINGSEKARVAADGRVGIATAVPQATLDVNGAALFGAGALKSTFTATPGGTVYALETSSGINVGGTGGVVAAFFSGNGAALTGISASDNTKVAKIGDTMSGPLTVLGSSIVVINNNAAQAFSFAVTSATDRGVYHLYVATTGRVDLNAGVFTVGGASLVVVNGGAAVGATNPAFIGASLALQGRTFQVFNGAANAQVSIRSAANAAIWSESGNGFAGRRLFFQQHFGAGNQVIWRNASETTGATNQDNILVLTSTGGVGIGVQPNARLHVSSASTNAADNLVLVSTTNGTTTTNLFRVQANGNVFAHGAMTGGGADVAEMYAAQPEVEPGDVVEFSPSGRLRRANESSRRVMGIISSNPGTLLGWDIHRQEMPEHRPLALAGRVPVKFSGENGAARRGDALTPASVPGFARRANAGELVIGSVLEDAGPGKVLAYVRSPDPHSRAELLELRAQNELLRRDLDELRRAVLKGREGGR